MASYDVPAMMTKAEPRQVTMAEAALDVSERAGRAARAAEVFEVARAEWRDARGCLQAALEGYQAARERDDQP